MNESMNTSSEFSDSNRFNTMDEDVLNYLSTLSSQQQKQLDDFVRKKILFILVFAWTYNLSTIYLTCVT